MASQASGLIGSAFFPASVVGIAVLLTVIAMLSNAPGEWGRGALTAYVVVALALIAGISATVLGGWAIAIAAFGVLALVIGGPSGLIVAGCGAGALALAHFAVGPTPVPVYMAISLFALSVASALRALLG